MRRFDAGTLRSEDMQRARAHRAVDGQLTFGGQDLRTVYLGSLFGTRIPCFRSPVAGLPLAHWRPGINRRA